MAELQRPLENTERRRLLDEALDHKPRAVFVFGNSPATLEYTQGSEQSNIGVEIHHMGAKIQFEVDGNGNIQCKHRLDPANIDGFIRRLPKATKLSDKDAATTRSMLDHADQFIALFEAGLSTDSDLVSALFPNASGFMAEIANFRITKQLSPTERDEVRALCKRIEFVATNGIEDSRESENFLIDFEVSRRRVHGEQSLCFSALIKKKLPDGTTIPVILKDSPPHLVDKIAPATIECDETYTYPGLIEGHTYGFELP